MTTKTPDFSNLPRYQDSTILLVDDDPTSLGILSNYLKDLGFRVIVARDGESALEKAAYGQPDLILLDLLMPKLNGFETCRLLKAREGLRDIPVIFMTGLTEMDDKIKGFQAGGVDYIIKPFQYEEVLARIKTHLHLHMALKQLEVQNAQLQLQITEREQADERLRQNRQELSEAQRLAKVGSWVWEPEPDVATWSEELYNVFGCDRALPAPNFREFQHYLTPESWNRLKIAVNESVQRGTPYQLDLEIIRKDGQGGWITTHGEAERDASGRVIKLRGTLQDITDRKKAEEELQWKTAFLEAQVHRSIDGILVVDSQGKNILQNQQMVDLWELPSDVANDRSDQRKLQFVILNRVKHPEQFLEKVNHLYTHPDEISRDEIELKNGRVLDRYSSPVIDKTGKYYGRIWTFRDITDRKQAEGALKKAHDTLEQRVEERTSELKVANDQLQQTNRLLHILSDCNQQVVHAEDEAGLLEEICSIIVGPGGYPSVWIGFAEDDPGKTVRPVAEKGFEEGYLKGLTITWADAELGRGPGATAIRTGKPSIVKDIQTSVDFAPWRLEAMRLGFASAIGLPLQEQGRVFGALTIYAKTPDAFPPREVDVLMELAGDLTYGIVSLRAREERKRAEENLLRSRLELSKAQRMAKIGSWVWEPEHDVVTWTEELYEIFGWDPSLPPPAVKDFHPYFTAESWNLLYSTLENSLKTGNAYELDLEIVRRDGQKGWVTICGETQRDASGRIVKLRGTGQDITERKRTEEALHLSEQKFLTIFRSSPVALCVSDLESGRFIEINEAMLRLVRATSFEQIIGHTSTGLGLLTLEQRKQMVDAMLQRGHVDRMEIDSRRLDGDPITVEISVSRYKLDGRNYLLTNIVDITERKFARDEIQRLNTDLERRVAERTAELAAANRELETFNYSVSHDLRSPLRTVDGFARLLKEDYSAQLDPDAHKFLDLICSATERMDQLIRGLLNLSQISRTQIRLRPVNLSDMASIIAAQLQASEPKRVAEFIIAPTPKAEGDPEMLRSVLENLLGNAWKYSGKHPRARIEFGSTQAEGETVYYVRDDGAGFDPENVGKLFNAFQRLHNADEFPGTGVGLTIVQRIIQRHGGRIWAEGLEDKGATFYFTIPQRGETPR